MITTLTDTTASAIDKQMIEMRETFGANTIGRVLTLIIIATGDIEEPLEAAIAASHEHPARVIVVDADPEADSSGLDAEIRVGRDAGAVVTHLDQVQAAARGHHLDALRAGIERVLDQLLHHARRALDHLAGGDLVDHRLGKLADRHGPIIPGFARAREGNRGRRSGETIA